MYICTYIIFNMDTKLTLKLDAEVINRAKEFAKERKISLSRLIESYLDAITGKDTGSFKSSPLIEGLSGIIQLPENFDYRKERGDHLESKHA